MDSSSIDQAYTQLQTEFQDVATSVEALANKMQTAAQGGDQNATSWMLDLKQIALDVKDEQVQMNNLLQAIHGFVANANQQIQLESQQMQQPVQQQPMGGGMFGGRGGMFGGGGGMLGGGGGMFGGFLGGGFGRAMEMGAGIGLGEDLINGLFGR